MKINHTCQIIFVLLMFSVQVSASNPCTVITPIINCGDTVHANIPTGFGDWDYYPGVGSFLTGKEEIFSFTPNITGKYSLTLTGTNNNSVNYFYKTASAGCNRYSWQSIGYSYLIGNIYMIGNLTAGTTYYILVDAASDINGAINDFKIDCLNFYDPCASSPTNIMCGNSISFLIPQGLGAYDITGCNEFNNVAVAGKEIIFSYTPTTSGRMAIKVTVNNLTDCGYYIKEAANGCDSSGWTCLGGIGAGPSYSDTYNVTAGTTYYIMADAIYLRGAEQTFIIICPEIWDPCSNITALSCSTAVAASIPIGFGVFDTIGQFCEPGFTNYYFTGKEAVYTFKATISGIHQIEITSTDFKGVNYMIKDTTGGCNASGWSCIGSATYPSSLYTPFDLIAGNMYYIMLVATSPFGANQTFNIHCDIPFDPCPAISTINCSSPVTHYLPPGRGKFMNEITSWFAYADGKEVIYEFTPAVSGTHLVSLISHTGGTVFYFIKEVTLGCNENNWNYLGNVSNAPLALTIPIPLTAGTDYYIMADAYNNNSPPGDSETFEIICPAVAYDPCINIVSIPSCGSIITTTHAAGLGSMSPYPLPGGFIPPAMGTENIFSFTPGVTGKYTFMANAGSGTGSVIYSIKPASSGCNANDWLSFGEYYNTGGNNYASVILMELQAGTQYYILADAEDTVAKTQTFSITCPVPYNPCANIIPLNCGNYRTDIFPTGKGAYSIGCGFIFPQGSELIYSFTPQETGKYFIEGNIQSGCNIYYKEMAGGCSGSGWNCIAGDIFGSIYNITPDTLFARVPYYIMMQSLTDWGGGSTVSFRISCQANCTIYADADGDGFGDPSLPVIECASITGNGYSPNNNDCNDIDSTIHPGAIEICNGIDDDCNNLIDDACVVSINNYYADDNLSVYPNPAENELHFTGKLLAGKVGVTIFNSMGELIYNNEIINDTKLFKISLKNFSSGLYIASVRYNGQNKMVRFVRR